MKQMLIEWAPTIVLLLVSSTYWLMRAAQRRLYRSVVQLLRARSQAYDASAKVYELDGYDIMSANEYGKADAYSRAAMLVAHAFLDGPEPPEDLPARHDNED